MKRLLLSVILCLSSSFVFAKIDHLIESSTTNEQDMDNIFQNLDKSAVTTCILYDRVPVDILASLIRKKSIVTFLVFVSYKLKG